MIIKDSLRSLKNSFSKAVFYWLTFVLTSMFIFLFFNISMSDTVGVQWIDNDNGIATTVTVFVIAVCLVILFFANDFYVRNKSKDLAVRLVCGATYLQLAEYLLLQTFLLLLFSIPVGIVLALMAIPVMNSAITFLLDAPFIIEIHSDAVFVTVLILVMIVFWTTYLNLAFAYRNSASSMLNERKMTNPLSGVEFYKNPRKKKQGRWKKILWIVMFALPPVLLFTTENMIIPLSIIGMTGFAMMIKRVLIPFITNYISEKKISDPLTLGMFGFLRSDLMIMRFNIILFIVSSVMLIAIVMSPDMNPAEMMLAMLSYIVMNTLLALAIMFKYSTELAERKGYFTTMSQIGYLRTQLNRMIVLETTAFYGFVTLVSLLYLESIMISQMMRGAMRTELLLPLTAFLVIPLVICWLITMYYYRSVVFSTKKLNSDS